MIFAPRREPLAQLPTPPPDPPRPRPPPPPPRPRPPKMIFAPRREPLAKLPTPLLDLARLGTILGGPRLLIKRDDLGGFALGGNKVRKLEFFLADARTAGADVLITCGGVQSNHCRVTAAAAARASMRCVLVLSGATPARFTGNLLLDQLFGAELVFVETRQERAPRMEALAAEFRAKGLRPHVT